MTLTNAQAALIAICTLNATRHGADGPYLAAATKEFKEMLDVLDEQDREARKAKDAEILEATYGIKPTVDLTGNLQHFLTDEHTERPRCACGYAPECDTSDSSQRQARYLIRNHVERETGKR